MSGCKLYDSTRISLSLSLRQPALCYLTDALKCVLNEFT